MKRPATSSLEPPDRKRERKAITLDVSSSTQNAEPLPVGRRKRKRKRHRNRRAVEPPTDLGGILEASLPLAASSNGNLGSQQYPSKFPQSAGSSPIVGLSVATKYEKTLEALTAHLTCEICAEIFSKPFAVVPCGHVACYHCLVTWFQMLPSALETDEGRPSLSLRRKICPICRTTLVHRPIEMFTIKKLCKVFSSQSPVEQLPHLLDSAQDPWADIFPHYQGSQMMGAGIIVDLEDGGVSRCRDCMHEIWNGVCTGCDQVFANIEIGGSEDSFQSGFIQRYPANGIADDERCSSIDTDSESYEASFIDDSAVSEASQELEMHSLVEHEALDCKSSLSYSMASSDHLEIQERDTGEYCHRRARRQVVLSDSDSNPDR